MILTCKSCNEPFKAVRSAQQFCSRNCFIQHTNKSIEDRKVSILCPICNTTFKSLKENSKFCSKECYYQHMRNVTILKSITIEKIRSMESANALNNLLDNIKKIGKPSELLPKEIKEELHSRLIVLNKKKKSIGKDSLSKPKHPERIEPESKFIPIVSKDDIDPWVEKPEITNITGWLESWEYEYDLHKDMSPFNENIPELQKICTFCKDIKWKQGRTNKDIETGQEIYNKLQPLLTDY